MKNIPAKIQRQVDSVERAVAKAAAKELKRILKEVARPLLNRFQRKIKKPVCLLAGNGEFFLGTPPEKIADRKYDFSHLNRALDDYALERRHHNVSHLRDLDRLNAYYVNRFPELVDLWQLLYALDGLPGRYSLDFIYPSVKPRK